MVGEHLCFACFSKVFVVKFSLVVNGDQVAATMKQNNFPDICEFELRIKNGVDHSIEFDCLADFRVRAEEILLGDEECEVFFVKVTISLHLEGFEPIPGSRFGEPKKVNVVERVEECHATMPRNRDVTIRGGEKLGLSGGKSERRAGLSG